MSAVGNLLPVLQTKLYRPRITQDYVRRSRLNDRLKQIEYHPLTLVSAPAGYGKSVLLSAWLEHCGCPGAWLSLDENDNDLGSFVSYFLAALRSAIPSFGDGFLDLLDSARLPPTRTFVEMLSAELSQLDERSVGVFEYNELRWQMLGQTYLAWFILLLILASVVIVVTDPRRRGG